MMRNILKIVNNALFIIIIVILVGYFALRMLNKIEIYGVTTGSMENNIHAGDYILIIRKNDYNIGDIVTYKKSDYFITHRIVKKDNNIFVTKGDANNLEDDAINISDIEGKVIMTGGILNIIINYKFAIAAIWLSLYLISCYFDKEKKNL